MIDLEGMRGSIAIETSAPRVALSAVGWSCIVTNFFTYHLTSKESDEPSRDLCSRVVLSAAVSESNRSESLAYYLPRRVSSTIERPPIDQTHVSPRSCGKFESFSISRPSLSELLEKRSSITRKQTNRKQGGYIYKRREKRRR